MTTETRPMVCQKCGHANGARVNYGEGLHHQDERVCLQNKADDHLRQRAAACHALSALVKGGGPEKHVGHDWNDSADDDGSYRGVWLLRGQDDELLIDLPRPDFGEVVWIGYTYNGECQTWGVVEDVELAQGGAVGWAKVRVIDGAPWRHFDENGVIHEEDEK